MSYTPDIYPLSERSRVILGPHLNQYDLNTDSLLLLLTLLHTSETHLYKTQDPRYRNRERILEVVGDLLTLSKAAQEAAKEGALLPLLSDEPGSFNITSFCLNAFHDLDLLDPHDRDNEATRKIEELSLIIMLRGKPKGLDISRLDDRNHYRGFNKRQQFKDSLLGSVHAVNEFIGAAVKKGSDEDALRNSYHTWARCFFKAIGLATEDGVPIKSDGCIVLKVDYQFAPGAYWNKLVSELLNQPKVRPGLIISSILDGLTDVIKDKAEALNSPASTIRDIAFQTLFVHGLSDEARSLYEHAYYSYEREREQMAVGVKGDDDHKADEARGAVFVI